MGAPVISSSDAILPQMCGSTTADRGANITSMEWRADGSLLAVRRHGESAAIVEIFAAEQGRHLGVDRGGASRKLATLLQVGAQLDVTWRARLADHLGAYTVDLVKGRAAEAMGERVALAGLAAMCGLLSFALPERAPHPSLYARSIALLDGLGAEAWPRAYLGWERALLEEMGFGLDLETCAATGTTEDLAYVSPKTGRAVSRGAAGGWADRLLPLPDVLRGGEGGTADVLRGLETTGHFLDHHLAPSLGDRKVPGARRRLIDAIARAGRRP